MAKKIEDGLIHRYYLTFGIIGCLITVINMLGLLLWKNGIFRIEYQMLYFITIPNSLARLMLMGWTLHYVFTGSYGRDVNLFAKNLIGLLLINIIITAFDESTVLFYLIQSVTCLMYAVFISILVNQKKFTVRMKSYATLGYVVNIFLYVIIAILAFMIVISFSNYDPYIVTFIGITHLCVLAAMSALKLIENKYIEEMLDRGNEGAVARHA